jgi:hypothetical protein
MNALKQLDSLDADSRVLNQFRISLFKQFADQDVISIEEFNSVAY